MGVKSCSRTECDNIMCDTYIPGGIGYICFDCQKEFKEFVLKKEGALEFEMLFDDALREFMDASKTTHNKTIKINVDAFFVKYTS